LWNVVLGRGLRVRLRLHSGTYAGGLEFLEQRLSDLCRDLSNELGVDSTGSIGLVESMIDGIVERLLAGQAV
jgi:hypothetical protein